ncbi:MAG: hypothetical protein HY820_15615 [Acidobacteria bacterium]|nr:hypothetical protein [Acidobacteriota bacterium]
MKSVLCLSVTLLCAHAEAQYTLPLRVVNAASQWPGPVAPGSRITIHGTQFGSSPALALSRGNQSISLTVLRASARRIDAILPSKLALGDYDLSVDSTARVQVTIAASALALDSRNGQGWGPAQADRKGNIVTLSVTGLGSANSVEVLAASRPARVLRIETGSGRIHFELPRDVPRTCHVPLQARVARGPLSNTVTVATVDDCPVPPGFPFARWKKGASAIVFLSRTREASVTRDEVTASFFDLTTDVRADGALIPPIPAGSCATYLFSGNRHLRLTTSALVWLVSALRGRPLDAGARLALQSQRRQWEINRRIGVAGAYLRESAHTGGMPFAEHLLFLDDPQLRVAAKGGKDIQPFLVPIEAPPPFQWTNRPAQKSIRRSDGLHVAWTGVAASRILLLIAGSEDTRTQTVGLCFCIASPQTGRFRILPELLAHLPQAPGIINLTSWPATTLTPIPARGLQQGVAASIYSHTAAVSFH